MIVYMIESANSVPESTEIERMCVCVCVWRTRARMVLVVI